MKDYLPQSQYRLPILLSLVNGEATVDEAIRMVYEDVRASLTYDDVNTINAKDEPAWRNRVRWTANALKKEGLVVSPDRGVWSLTNQGRNVLKQVGVII